MKKILIIAIALLVPVMGFAQSYVALWKQVSEAEQKDLPKTQYEVLQQIAAKAQTEQQYGQLLKAELYGAQVLANIAPDSLKPAINRIVANYRICEDPVLRTVYQTVLWQMDKENDGLKLGIEKPELTSELCHLLAKTKDKTLTPFVVLGADAKVFNNDLLSVVGAELEEYQLLRDYYRAAGNKKAVEALDAKLAVDQFDDLKYTLHTPIAEKMAYIDEAIKKWGQWQVINELRNAKTSMTNPEFRLKCEHEVGRPMQAQKVMLEEMRNIRNLTMTIYPVNCEGDIEETPDTPKGWAKIKKLLGKAVVRNTKHFAAHAAYEHFNDSITMPGLPVGMYLVELNTTPATEVQRMLYHVTNIYTMAEAQPGGKMRYVVVNATTGAPIPDAQLRIKELSTDRYSVFAYTDSDKAGIVLTGSKYYGFNEAEKLVKQAAVFTDRSIYRPGQKVQASALAYEVENGIKQTVCSKRTLTFVLRDANYKVVAEKKAETNDFGVAAVDFDLPAKGRTGMFVIQVENSSQRIRVEEYKRPTFHVDFTPYKETYKAGDVLELEAMALSYAGVPVQEAKVSYKVTRNVALWWRYMGSGEEIYTGVTTTDADGRFVVKMPLVMPETPHAMFYNYVVKADVTDAAGETHQAQYTLPLGNRTNALSIDMADQVLAEDNPKATFHLRNAAGQDVDAEVSYRIDGSNWMNVKTDQQIALAKLTSGKHRVEVAYQDQTIERTFVVFSLRDEKPVVDTVDWFYQSGTQFPSDGTPVTIQVGSSASDVHIFYSIFAGKKVIEQGEVVRNNQLINRQFTYKEEYGNGLLLNYAWVKDGHCYTHQAEIKRPLPNKKLTLEWATFRDRLKPGQQEEWTLTVKDSEGKPVDANLMATLYDKSLDQIVKHQWRIQPYQWVPMPYTRWNYRELYPFSWYVAYPWTGLNSTGLRFSAFDHSIFPEELMRPMMVGYGTPRFKALTRANALETNAMFDYVTPAAEEMAIETEGKMVADQTIAEEPVNSDVQLRKNLNETAFFYPQLTTDAEGRVAIKFTLPESLTTWQLLGFAHTRDLCYGDIQSQTVAKKEVMIQPNVPRFIREGDEATISARIFSEKQAQGKATLQLINAETNAIVFEKSQSVQLKANETTPVSFDVKMVNSLICKMSITGKGFSDGEQHYLPVLPAQECITVAQPITQHQPGTETIDLQKLVPAGVKDAKFTLEYTNNPVWLMAQALPAMASPSADNAISLAAAIYANGIGRYIIQQNPQIKPDADMQQMNDSLQACINKLQKLQNADGAWAWFPGMQGSLSMTVAVSEMLVRLNALTTRLSSTSAMLDKAFSFMGAEMVKQVKELRLMDKKGHEAGFPGRQALQWLYIHALDGRQLPADVQAANGYLIELLKKDVKNQSIYDKALSAVIFAKTDLQRARTYVQSLKEYTVYREDMGRYYDTQRADYSWFDYKIPTQTIAIEALQTIMPDDQLTIGEMQRWLLQQKRTQAWDTPINSVNAIYAFLKGQTYLLREHSQMPAVKLDARTVALPKDTTVAGYIKTDLPKGRKLTIRKTTDGTSWGAVFAQFYQPAKQVTTNGSGLTIQREITLVGKRARVRLTITADRDYDFVQVVDKRAACMEPVKQLSGYHHGAYIAPGDQATHYYYDMLRKGTHVIETEYYLDRPGTYETGTAIVECTYAPEFRGVTKSETIEVKK